MKQYYREKSGEVKYGELPQDHPANNYSDKNKKKVKSGHTVKFKKHGEDKERTGRVVSVGKHGAVIHCNEGKAHDVFHHEIIKHIGGRDNFKNNKKIIDLTKAMLPNNSAKNFLPTLRASISMLRGLSSYDHSNKMNDYRYKLEELRNRIISGNDIPSEDINNMNILMEQVGREVRTTNKSKFKLRY